MSQQEQGRTSTSTRAEADRLSQKAEDKGREARAEAANVVEEARSAVRDVSSEARATGRALKDEAKGIVGTVREGIAAQAEAQKDEFASRIGAIAERVHATAGDLRERESWLATIVDRGAQELDEVAEAIRRRDVTNLWGAVETFARRQPAVFMGAMVAAGFAVTRLARASVERQYGGTHDGGYGRGTVDTGRRYGQGSPSGAGSTSTSGSTGTTPSLTGAPRQPGATEYERHVQGASAGGGHAAATAAPSTATGNRPASGSTY
jgi:hypothetical protein